MNDYPLIREAISSLILKADDELETKLDTEGYIKPKKTVEEINTVNDSLTEILENEQKLIVSGINGEELDAANDLLPALLSSDNSDELISTLFSDSFTSFMEDIADAYVKDIDKDLAFSLFCDRTTDWISDWSKQLGEIMKLNSHEKIKVVLSDALENGESIQDVVDKLTEAYEFSPARARSTAITELLTAHSYAKQEAFRQSPAVNRKAWRHTGEHKNHPRPHHQALDGMVIDKNAKFTIVAPTGTYECDFPRDISLPASERVNCHCIHQAVVDDSIFGLTLDERKALQQQAIDDDNGEWEKELKAKNKAKAGIDF